VTGTDVRWKTYGPRDLVIKGGHVEAVFSVAGMVDRDSDMVMPGAVPSGITVPVSQWGHASWQPGYLPIGLGRIRTTGNDAVVSADFFGTKAAREHLHVLDRLGEHGRWSFGFLTLDADFANVEGRRVQRLKRLDVVEVSPTLVPSNNSTRTLSVSASEDGDVLAEAQAIAEQFEQEAADRAVNEYARAIALGLEVA
jgi:hypothetical protein